MTCPKCGKPMTIRVKLTGGCQGHDSGERCYCNSADVHAEWRCDNYEKYMTTGKRPREMHRYCNQLSIPIYELGDQYAIERWLQENYGNAFMLAAKKAIEKGG